MGRRPPPVIDTRRRLAVSKIWNGEIWNPGDEDFLPPDFPMDGPHWDDYVEDEPADPVLTKEQRRYAMLTTDDQAILDRAQQIIEERQRDEAIAEMQAEEEFEKQNDVARLPKATKRTPTSRAQTHTLVPVEDEPPLPPMGG